MHKTRKKFSAVLMLAIVLAMGLATTTYGQIDTGSILGTVKDPSGAIVPNAKVTLLNTATSVSFMTDTNASGNYSFPAIKTGAYQVTVEAPGFKKSVRSGIQLSIQQQAEIDFTLETGDISQSVEVTAAAPLLQTQDASVGQAVSGQTINNLPLNGRDWTYLARLSVGGRGEGDDAGHFPYYIGPWRSSITSISASCGPTPIPPASSGSASSFATSSTRRKTSIAAWGAIARRCSGA